MPPEEPMLEGEFSYGIIAGLQVCVIEEADGAVWVAPNGWLSKLILTPYMLSWFYNDNSPIFIYEGSYPEGLLDWLITPIPDPEDPQ